jgi:NTE family protein
MIDPYKNMAVMEKQNPRNRVNGMPSPTPKYKFIVDTKSNKSSTIRIHAPGIVQLRKDRNTKINNNFTNMAFEGGGVRGFAYSGALFFLQEYDIIPQIKNVIGSSVGSITALLVALGLDAYEIFVEMLKTDFNKFADDNFGIVRDLERFYKRFGIYKGEAMQKSVEDLLEKYAGKRTLTFMELYNKTKINLIVTGNTMKTVYFHKDNMTYPNMPISIAIRISTALPYAYQYVEYEGRKFTDGGLFANLPIGYWDE